jgi:tetratricopeptide (TPR) repeat protein
MTTISPNRIASPLRRALRVTVGVASLAMLAAPAFAESEFEKGNAFYEAGSYAEAAKSYEKSIQDGVSGANVYFNLGNANLREGAKGLAVLNYQRALALRPGHPEAAANLAFVRRDLNLPTAPASAWNQVVEWIGLDATAVIAAVGAWIILIGLVVILGPWRRTSVGWSLVIAGALPCVAGLMVLIGLHGGARDPARAIVISEDETKAHYAPADNSRDVRTLAAGSEIRLLQDRGSWVYVEVADGVRGWLAAEAVETIVPRAAVVPGS